MRRKKAAVLVALLGFGLTGLAVAQEPEAARPSAQARQQEGVAPARQVTAPALQITVRSDQQITGIVRRASVRIAFDAWMESPSSTMLRLELGDAVLTAEVDHESGTRTMTGSGKELSDDESSALKNLSSQLQGRLLPFNGDLPRHEDLLSKAVSFWAGVPAGGPLLDVTRHTDDAIVGGFRSDARSIAHAGSLDLSYASRLETPTRVLLQLHLGDHILEADVDFEKRVASLKGSGRPLSADQIQTLIDFGAQYERYLTPDNRDTLPQEDIFYRVLSIWAQYPPGQPIESRVVSAPVRIGRLAPIDPASESFESLGVGPICGCRDNCEELNFVECLPSSASFCTDPDPDTIVELEGACACRYYDAWHDHPFHPGSDNCCREKEGAGCDLDADCVGKCGTGCDGTPDCRVGGSDGAGYYTYDCLNHDRCVRVHGSLSPYCQDEFYRTFDDCLFADPILPGPGVKNCDGCPPCGDGFCDPRENCSDCPVDCGGQCGNGCCDGAENACSCPSDCFVAVCGDGCLNGSETCASCPGDCNVVCSDNLCNGIETTCSCPSDCGSSCGDGCCNGGETSGNCCQDCGGCPTQLTFECVFIEDRNICVPYGDLCRNDGDPFTNVDPVFLNVTLFNETGSDVDYEFQSFWYNPSGILVAEGQPTGNTLQDNYWTCWSFGLSNLERCPGDWRVKLKIREGSTGTWQTAVSKQFEMRFDNTCTSDAECEDGNPCTSTWCDCTCQSSNNAAPCDDGVFCNGPDTCEGGSCSLHEGDPCAGGPDCANSCNDGVRNCLDPAGTPCDDDGNECTDDECDGDGFCVHPAKSDGTACDDGDPDTCPDECAGGLCASSPCLPCGNGQCDALTEDPCNCPQDCGNNAVITEIIDATGDGAGNGLVSPRGIAVDAFGNAYVAGWIGNNAFKITPAGVITEIIDASGDGAGNGLNRPFDLTVDGSGNAYVAGGGTNNVFKITPAGIVIEIIDAFGDGGGNGLEHPYGITVDGAGNVYVTGFLSHNAFKITPAGVITEIIDAAGDGAGHALQRPEGIAVDAGGNAYVAGAESGNAFKITSAGVITEIIDAAGDGMDNGFSGPRFVTIDGSGNAYATGFFSENAFKITPAGVITEIIDATGDGAGNGLDRPYGIAVDAAGNAYVAGGGSVNVFKIAPASLDCNENGIPDECEPAASCGDGFVCGIEVCDDGNASDCDGCRADCSAVETGCGDGFVCGIEECDDGNNVNGDGCDESCIIEPVCDPPPEPADPDPADAATDVPIDSQLAWADPVIFTERVISATADGATSVFAMDVDGDGDTDVLSASSNDDKIAWYESDGGSPPAFTEQVISGTADVAMSVFAMDVDGDGDTDVLSASRGDDKIAWYESDGGSPPVFAERIISITGSRPYSVFAADVDGDGHTDVLSASATDNKIAWYESDGGSPPVFTERVISTAALHATSVFAADVDGDGDTDVLSASERDNKVAWYENDGGMPPVFVERVISTTAEFAHSVFVADVDGDGDADVLSASYWDSKIAWYESDGGMPPVFTERVVSTTGDWPVSVFAADVDGDGHTDVLSASATDNKIAWYESDGGSPPVFAERVISTTADYALSVFAADVDGDGDIDVLSASENDDKIAWYENRSGGPCQTTYDVYFGSDPTCSALAKICADLTEATCGPGPLDCQTTYYWKVVAKNAAGETEGPCWSFTTEAHVQNLTTEVWYCTIQSAIDAATAGDEIVLNPHTYSGDGNRDLDFGGKDVTVRSTDPLDPAVVAATIIDCQGTGTDPHRGFVFHSGETAASVVSGLTITNCHAADGMDGNETAPDGGQGSHGGGVYCEGASPTITHCVLMANSAGSGGNGWIGWGDGGDGGRGGGIYCSNASPTITGCVLMANSAGSGGAAGWEGYGGAGGSGGAIYCDGGSPAISDGTLTGNSAGDGGPAAMLGGPGGSGGAVYASTTTSLVMASCDITGNSAGNGGVTGDWQTTGGAGGGGGGIDSPGSLTLLSCRISGNTAGNGGECYYGRGGSGGSGGGVSCGANATITECIITGNSAGSGSAGFGGYDGGNGGAGGGLSCGENATIGATVIAGNVAGHGALGYPGGAGGDGGGVHCDNDAMIRNCVINGNSAGRGGDAGWDLGGGNGGSGGGILAGETAAITNCTLTSNTAGSGGDGGDYGVNGDDGTGGGATLGGASTMASCVAWGNTATIDQQISGSPTVIYSCIQGGGGSEGNIDTDPAFAEGSVGSWTSDSLYDPETYITVFTDSPGDWTVGELVGKLVNPDTAQPFQFVIIANTAETISIHGDASAIAQAGESYEIYDYHLQPTSLCINAGDPAFVADENETDIDGEARVQHCRVDIGADESPVFLNDCQPNGIADECDPNADGDEAPDDCDNCPEVANPLHADTDGDSAGDLCDICPADAADECDPDGSVAEEILADDGGTVVTPDGDVTIDIDPGDLAEDTTISITETVFTDPEVDLLLGASPGLGNAVAVYVFEPDGLVFDNPVTLTIVKDVSHLNENQRERFNLYLYVDPNYTDLGADCPVVEDSPGTFIATCTAHLDHLSTYGAIAPLDTDDDSMPDLFPPDEDNCPNDPNPLQQDADGDSVGDVCDNCPNDTNLTQDDSDEDSIGDICDNCPADFNPEQNSISAAPVAAETCLDAGWGTTSRFLSVVPGNPGRQTGIRVTFPDPMPSPYEAWNGLQMWAGPPTRYCENSGNGEAPSDTPPIYGCDAAPGLLERTYLASTLQCGPFYMDWHGVCDTGTCTGGMRAGLGCTVDADCAGPIYLFHEGIIPSTGPHNEPTITPTTYAVQVVDEACLSSEESAYSGPLNMTTSKWGDTVLDLQNTPYDPPEGIVQITDVLAILQKFQNLGTASISARVDLMGATDPKYLPDHMIDIGDVLQALFAFQAQMYPSLAITGVPTARPCQ